MKTTDQRYIVGIDLGTTNSAVSYVDLEAEGQDRRIEIFAIPQLTGPGEISELEVLPSFLYIPGEYDIAREAITMPWPTAEDNFAGAFARDHGSKVPARLVASAKSWMCHGNVDRRAKILPWGSGNEVAKVSPIQASAAYLTHIRQAWNQAHRDDEAALEEQIVIITVPASFDEVARELTVEAAAMAGLKGIILLEEPLAAFYSWLMTHEDDWGSQVQPNELILVCDVGGGTTDFTLIYLRDADGRLGFERIAVGDHLILGGDNIDLTLARRIEMQLASKKFSLKGDRWKTLCHQSRWAKERILSGVSDDEKIVILGEGGKLIGGTLTATLSRQDVEEAVLQGFFPQISAETRKKPVQRKGITEFGLPYEQEPAITRHLGWFLEKHSADVTRYLGKERPFPDLILFNGGSVKPAVIQQQICRAVGGWFGASDEKQPKILDNPNPDLAVSLGAAYYGLVKIGRGVRVGSGSPRSYYLEVAAQNGDDHRRQAICLVEHGLEEGAQVEIKEYNFEVLANQPVTFNLYSSTYRSGDRLGDLIAIDDFLTGLEPLQTIIHYGKKGAKTTLPIHLVAEYTEVGTLALWCKSTGSDHRWKLHFQLRNATVASELADQDVFDSDLVKQGRELVRKTFCNPSAGQELSGITKKITRLVGRDRKQWPLSFIRELADELLDLQDVRSLSYTHESRWLNLLGYCLRPGVADGADPIRIKKLWRLFSPGPIHTNKPQVRSEWWILWRRVAAGLSLGQQQHFVQEAALLLTGKKRQHGQVPPQERLEMWMAIANMERIQTKEKIRLGRILFNQLEPRRSKPQHFWSLSRIGARELLYGPVDRVVSTDEVHDWITILLETKWPDIKPVAAALAQLARKTGDRTRDLDQADIERIVQNLSQHNTEQEFLEGQLKYLKQVVAMADQEESVIFGEDLPTGIVLHNLEN